MLGMAIRLRVRDVIYKLLSYFYKPLIISMRSEMRRFGSRFRYPDQNEKNPLVAKGWKCFSQNDEDGIVLEILRRIGLTDSNTFVEFGVGDGTENNTIILVALGWTGVWIGGEALAFDFGGKPSRLAFLRRWITKDNAVALMSEGLTKLGKSSQDVRVVSVDLDGNDIHIVRSILGSGLQPDVFIVEYNAKFGPNILFEKPYESSQSWQLDDYMGASLFSYDGLFRENEYKLVACNRNGVNAFFVKSIYSDRFADVPHGIDELYKPGYYTDVIQASGHPTSPRTVHYFATRILPAEVDTA